MPNDNPKYSSVGRHHNNGSSRSGSGSGSVSGNVVAHELEEHTWEVPLLSREDSGNNLLHQQHHESGNPEHCHHAQSGFGANLKSKSAQEAKFKILLAISLCCIFMIIEFLGGYMAGSLAIMTDAAHLASDCISFVIGLVAIWLGGRPPDARMSFGYKRFEVLGALASILGIWLLTAMLVVVAIQRIYSRDFDLDVDIMMLISGIGIGINIIMMFVLHGSWFTTGHGHSHGNGHGHGHSHGGHSHAHATPPSPTAHSGLTMPNGHNVVVVTNGLKPTHQNGHSHNHSERNMNLRAAMIHVIGDLVQSIGVFLAAVLIKFCPSAKYADPLCTLLFSIIVIMTTVQLFRESVAILLDAVPVGVNLPSLEQELRSVEGVKSVHHLNVWQHTSEHSVLMAHIVIDPFADGDSVLAQATQLASGRKYNIKHATIQIERLTD
ncbi:zinc transporter 2 isoform X2 [Scaptodrosophila lebanonensis]|nr:zinc transporter 2 isoform X2 [Scaptodrosophila lebanonensis]